MIFFYRNEDSFAFLSVILFLPIQTFQYGDLARIISDGVCSSLVVASVSVQCYSCILGIPCIVALVVRDTL